MWVQNAIAALIFAILLAASAAMHLLSVYPTSSLLWFLNIQFAREVRPLLELADFVPAPGAVTVVATVGGLLYLCRLATRRGDRMMTAATTHSALFCAVYASITSYGANMGVQISSVSDLVVFASATTSLDPIKQAMAIMVAVLFVTCLCNHFGIVRELLRDVRGKFGRQTTASPN